MWRSVIFGISTLCLTVSAASTAATSQHAPKMQDASCSTRAYEAAMATMHRHMQVPLAGDADIDFVRQMIPHHEGAVAMAKVELQYGHDERLKDFARWIIRAQEQEIAWMGNWLERRDNGAHPAAAKDYYGPAMMAMHRNMMIDYTGDADIDFLRGMIPHHQGALDMASIWFAQGSDPEVKMLADEIYSGQSGEIAWMQRLLAARTDSTSRPD